MRKKKQEAEAVGFGTESHPAPRLTPMDVQQKEFRLAFRGYNERDVDAFLDLVTEELAAYIEENERLRRRVALAGSPDDGPAASADPGEAVARAEAQAQEILNRAREQAAQIVREAELEASGTSGARRSVIAPFLNREREFLKSLGRLVQDHAQSVREMVEQAKALDAAASAPAARPAERGGSGGRRVQGLGLLDHLAHRLSVVLDEPTEALQKLTLPVEERRDDASSRAARPGSFELGLADDLRGLLSRAVQDLLRLRLRPGHRLPWVGRRRRAVVGRAGQGDSTAQALVLLDVRGELLGHEVEEGVDVP